MCIYIYTHKCAVEQFACVCVCVKCHINCTRLDFSSTGMAVSGKNKRLSRRYFSSEHVHD